MFFFLLLCRYSTCMLRMSVGSPTPSTDSLSGTPIGSLIDSDPTRSLDASPPHSNPGQWGESRKIMWHALLQQLGLLFYN